jgi:hypothetical protein
LQDTVQMTAAEKKICKARQVGYSFCQLDDDDRRVAVDQIMIRAAAICGCVLPTTEFFATFIAEEISIFILEFGYEELTLEEILLSFRLNAKDNADIDYVSFVGNCINVDYVAKVLGRYNIQRKLLDRKFQNKIDGYEL